MMAARTTLEAWLAATPRAVDLDAWATRQVDQRVSSARSMHANPFLHRLLEFGEA
jgi:hypothetical protein